MASGGRGNSVREIAQRALEASRRACQLAYYPLPPTGVTIDPYIATDPAERAALRAAHLRQERQRYASIARLPVDECGELLDSCRGLAEEDADVMQAIASLRATASSVAEIERAAAELTLADRSALADVALRCVVTPGLEQKLYTASVAYAIAQVWLDEPVRAAMLALAGAAPAEIASAFSTAYELFHSSTPSIDWPSDDALRERALCHPREPGVPASAEPRLADLYDRLTRSERRAAAAKLTDAQLIELRARDDIVVVRSLRDGVAADFFVATPAGIFLIWTIDREWTAEQATLAMHLRTMLRADLGHGWHGELAAVFHSPNEPQTQMERFYSMDEYGRPIDLVLVTGRLDEVLATWTPITGVALDRQWIEKLLGALGQPISIHEGSALDGPLPEDLM